MKIIFFIMLLCLQIPVCAQQRVCLYDSITTHKSDIEKLDEHIAKLIKKDKNLGKYDNLKQFHIFYLDNFQSSYISKEEYQDYSFLKKLCFSYDFKRYFWVFKKKYLSSDTYIITQEGEVIGRYIEGHFLPRWAWDDNYIQALGKMYVNNKIDFAFCDGIEFNFKGLVKLRRYLIVQNDKIFVSADTDDLQLIPLEDYIKNLPIGKD